MNALPTPLAAAAFSHPCLFHWSHCPFAGCALLPPALLPHRHSCSLLFYAEGRAYVQQGTEGWQGHVGQSPMLCQGLLICSFFTFLDLWNILSKSIRGCPNIFALPCTIRCGAETLGCTGIVIVSYA